MKDKLTNILPTGSMNFVEIIAIAVFGVSALVSTGIATITLFDYSFGMTIWEFAMPVLGYAVTISLSDLVGVVAVSLVAINQGFDKDCWKGLSEVEQLLLTLGIAVFILPMFVPQVASVVAYNEMTRVIAFVLSSTAVYILGRSNYEGSIFGK